jgi:hypothetical protein
MKKLWLALALVAFPAASTAATRVSSDSNCPSSDAISQRLLGLLAAGGPAAASVRVRSEGESLRIELSTVGEADQQRTVPASGDCEARAEMAALVIASWLGAMPVGSISTPGVPPRAPLPAAMGRSTDSDPLDDPDNPIISISTRTLLGAGCFGLVDGKGGSVGFAIDAGMPTLLDHFGWNAQVSLGSPRQMAVGQGTAHYWRPTFALAATGEVRARNWLLRPQAGVAFGILSIRGLGFNDQNISATSFTWGAGAGVTLARAWRRGEAWLRLEGVLWPQGRAVLGKQLPSGPDIAVPFPDWELRLTAGLSWGIH